MCDRIPPLNIGSVFFFSCSLSSRHYTNGFQTSIAAPYLISSFIFYDFVNATYLNTFHTQASIILTVYMQNKRIFITKLDRFSKITF